MGSLDLESELPVRSSVICHQTTMAHVIIVVVIIIIIIVMCDMLLDVCRVLVGALRHHYHDGLMATAQTEIIQLLTQMQLVVDQHQKLNTAALVCAGTEQRLHRRCAKLNKQTIYWLLNITVPIKYECTDYVVWHAVFVCLDDHR